MSLLVILGAVLGAIVSIIMFSDMCWQSPLTFTRQQPAITTGVLFIVFWGLRYALGPQMYRFTCYVIPEESKHWWNKRPDLHDWQMYFENDEVFGESRTKMEIRCTRCFSSMHYNIGGQNPIYAWYRNIKDNQ